ncbi:hypothetical protein [Vulcanisaeta sp. JCM 16159]|uniref:hypothetical protein n=1 Tax=Vulcanisaeta sp. JCM 16159 TaxID=1295371 RepID=UPI001FB32BE4|nr:hypothetical protein [Vulcanisaeta sp. JCM 16159]
MLGFDGGPEAAGERGARARVQGEVVVSTIYSTDSYSDFIDYLTLRAANHMFIINQAALQQASQLFRTEGRLRGLRWMPEFKEVCDLAAMAYSEFLMARRIAPPSVESNYNMERGMVASNPALSWKPHP